MFQESQMVAARTAIESTYDGVMTVTQCVPTTDPETGFTENQEVQLLTETPCCLSYDRITVANEQDGVTRVSQIAKVFVSPDVEVPPGTKVTVKQNGMVRDFCRSGAPAVYATHQEITLDLFQEWA